MNEKSKNSINQYYEKLRQLESDPKVQLLKNFQQHCCTTRFDHCNDVAVCSYRIARTLRINIDEDSLLRGAMLHDYYLYDTMSGEVPAFEHWMHHPETALENASGIYDLNEKEKGIIRSHMWPLVTYAVPDSAEGWLVCIADKVCAAKEVLWLRVFKKVFTAA